MFVTCCRRCGETALSETNVVAMDVAGERADLCPRCADALRAWLSGRDFPAVEAAAPLQATSLQATAAR